MTLCLARLTHRTQHQCELGEKRVASIVKLCPNIAEPNEKLCKRCKERPHNGKALSIALHGDLTEEPPMYSHIFGGPWFFKWLTGCTNPLPEEWVQMADAAQKEAEQRCLNAGFKPWVPGEETEMPPKKAQAPPPVQTTKLPFKPIQQMYQESEEEPKMLPTDTQKIWKKDGMWIAASGHRFAIREDGGIGKYIGLAS